ncbi:MAG: glycogen synthase, partial [Myxococcota bacterium]
NNAFPGRCDPSLMRYTGLPQELFHADGLEAWGDLALLKGGLTWADRIIAVSPTYAAELQEPYSGLGLEGVYSQRASRLVGIANGIDTARYDPAGDIALAATFGAHDFAGKVQCRDALLRELALDPEPGGLLLGAVGRFSRQKGWDVLADSLDALVQRGHRVALLGDGDVDIARRLTDAARRHPRQVAVRVAFDETLSRRIYAGVDVMLVPSRFEPCGLVQLIAQRYGALPVAHATGGLRDTIVDARDVTGAPDENRSTGVLFSPLTSEALVQAVASVEPLLTRGALRNVQRRLCGLDVSFAAAAPAYEQALHACTSLAAHRLA